MMTLSGFYPLSPGVRAREEAFGLLFYNSRDAKLTFVKCGNLLKVERASDGSRGLIPFCKENEKGGRLEKCLASLSKKGLILEP
jgi:putative mycofactocin binding protein MftB